MKQPNNKFLAFILVFIIIFVIYKMWTQNNKKNTPKIIAYATYNYSYGYKYDKDHWIKYTDMAFLNNKTFTVYAKNKYVGAGSASLNSNLKNINFLINKNITNNLLGLSSNSDLNVKKIKLSDLNEEDTSFIKKFLSSKGNAYFNSTQVLKVIIDTDGDKIRETLFLITYKDDTSYYNYFVIKNEKSETIIINMSEKNLYNNYPKNYELYLITDIDNDGKIEFWFIENSYEKKYLKLYANQYGMYQSIE